MHPESIRGNVGSRIRDNGPDFVATFADYEIKVQRGTALVIDVGFASAVLVDEVATGAWTPINGWRCAIADEVI